MRAKAKMSKADKGLVETRARLMGKIPFTGTKEERETREVEDLAGKPGAYTKKKGGNIHNTGERKYRRDSKTKLPKGMNKNTKKLLKKTEY
jgi:hypothetical protein